MNKNIKRNKGFTLIEILVVIGIIAILATIVLIAINPARQFAQARDTQRVSNINAVLNAIGQRVADGHGVFAGTFTAGGTNYTCPDLTLTTAVPAGTITVDTPYKIYNGSTGGAANSIDLSCLTPTYMPSFPVDPTTASGNNTGYFVGLNPANRLTASSTGEVTASLSVTR